MVPAVYRARRLAAAGSSRHGRAGPQHGGLGVAQVDGVHRGRRLHGDQRHHLQQVALDHVGQRAGLVVVAGPVLQGQLLVVDDVDALDVLVAPQRLEQPVGEPQAEQVEDCRAAEEVVDPLDLVLVDQLGSAGRLSAAALAASVPNGFSRASTVPVGQLDRPQRLAGGHRDGGRQGEVDGRGRRPGTHQTAQILGVGDVRLDVAGAGP